MLIKHCLHSLHFLTKLFVYILFSFKLELLTQFPTLSRVFWEYLESVKYATSWAKKMSILTQTKRSTVLCTCIYFINALLHIFNLMHRLGRPAKTCHSRHSRIYGGHRPSHIARCSEARSSYSSQQRQRQTGHPNLKI